MDGGSFERIRKPHTFRERAADAIAKVVGSWTFLGTQSLILTLWVLANTLQPFGIAWDPYPFIFMNLVLSLQAAYTAPILMMSQNRQADIDRDEAQLDYYVNKMTEQQSREILSRMSNLERDVQEMKRLMLKRYGN